MAVELDRMHCELYKNYSVSVLSPVVTQIWASLPVSTYTFHSKFMQMAPPCVRLGSYRDVERACGHSFEQSRITRRG